MAARRTRAIAALPLVAVGERIAARRRALGMTQAELAERVGVSRYTIMNLETAVKDVGASTLWQVLVALDLVSATPREK